MKIPFYSSWLERQVSGNTGDRADWLGKTTDFLGGVEKNTNANRAYWKNTRAARERALFARTEPLDPSLVAQGLAGRLTRPGDQARAMKYMKPIQAVGSNWRGLQREHGEGLSWKHSRKGRSAGGAFSPADGVGTNLRRALARMNKAQKEVDRVAGQVEVENMMAKRPKRVVVTGHKGPFMTRERPSANMSRPSPVADPETLQSRARRVSPGPLMSNESPLVLRAARLRAAARPPQAAARPPQAAARPPQAAAGRGAPPPTGPGDNPPGKYSLFDILYRNTRMVDEVPRKATKRQRWVEGVEADLEQSSAARTASRMSPRARAAFRSRLPSPRMSPGRQLAQMNGRSPYTQWEYSDDGPKTARERALRKHEVARRDLEWRYRDR